jgi:hypothetical protein
MLRPITFTSKAPADDPTRRHFGLIAEEVAEVDERLIFLDAKDRPDGVQYDRIIPALLNVVKRLEQRVAQLEAA